MATRKLADDKGLNFFVVVDTDGGLVDMYDSLPDAIDGEEQAVEENGTDDTGFAAGVYEIKHMAYPEAKTKVVPITK